MTRFTQEEQRTLMTLWSIAQSPLMFGGDLPSNDAFTLSLLDNDELLQVDQHGIQGRAFQEAGSSVVWATDADPVGARYFAVFSVADRDAVDIRVDWVLGASAAYVLRDVWKREDVGTVQDGYTFHVAPHGSGIYKLSPK